MREITCDESGYEGEKLVDTTTQVFAHSSVFLVDKAPHPVAGARSADVIRLTDLHPAPGGPTAA